MMQANACSVIVVEEHVAYGVSSLSTTFLALEVSEASCSGPIESPVRSSSSTAESQ
jgi:hypothetical protein